MCIRDSRTDARRQPLQAYAHSDSRFEPDGKKCDAKGKAVGVREAPRQGGTERGVPEGQGLVARQGRADGAGRLNQRRDVMNETDNPTSCLLYTSCGPRSRMPRQPR